jgi:uncharacterized membrane protein (UPF0127 family)
MTLTPLLSPFRTLALALAFACAAVPLAAGAQGADGKPQSLPTTRIQVGAHAVTAEVASTPEQRALGLMFRFSLPADRGMLFVFAEPEMQGFWMRNTYVPLSIAFIDAAGTILNVDDMAPHDESRHLSRGPALYALEMRKGWFAERQIGPGTRITGLPPASKR